MFKQPALRVFNSFLCRSGVLSVARTVSTLGLRDAKRQPGNEEGEHGGCSCLPTISHFQHAAPHYRRAVEPIERGCLRHPSRARPHQLAAQAGRGSLAARGDAARARGAGGRQHPEPDCWRQEHQQQLGAGGRAGNDCAGSSAQWQHPGGHPSPGWRRAGGRGGAAAGGQRLAGACGCSLRRRLFADAGEAKGKTAATHSTR